ESHGMVPGLRRKRPVKLPGSQRGILMVPEGGSAQLLGAAFRNHLDQSAAGGSILGGKTGGDDFELADGIGRERRGGAADAGRRRAGSIGQEGRATGAPSAHVQAGAASRHVLEDAARLRSQLAADTRDG